MECGEAIGRYRYGRRGPAAEAPVTERNLIRRNVRQNVLSLAFAAVLAAAAAAGPVFAAEPNAPPAIPPEGAGLTSLLLDKPEVPVTPPKGPAPERRPARPAVEGSMVVDRPCELVADLAGDWHVLTFPPVPGRRDVAPRRALPCRLLAEMERIAARRPDVRFRVSGETTVFDGQAYLLLTKATVQAPPAPPARSGKPARKPPGEAAPNPDTPAAPRTRPASTGPATRPGDADEPSSDDVLASLLSEKVGRPISVPKTASEPSADGASVAPTAARAIPTGRGGMVVDRLVRVVPEETGGWHLARFEADNTLQEPPMRVLPSGFLARALKINAADARRDAPLLRVSGRVTRYKGRRYLLLRKVLRQRHLGRF